ncbi:dCTP deaminase domain-containing protein [Sphingobacterium corticibacter]|uniref:Deoxycytidine triphosphate deaminase n=1 Tax=Sphingobacterium corticibacter TaxID=2171749 RepID=A0A2T8HH08_9SPHI|nr:deoxycytidine triphosphate deaminase [Sphingobacterium corticibacter]PVH24728.1 deoxycytidine triphosphate deaminase [Sphingobacterium corticibacter]
MAFLGGRDLRLFLNNKIISDYQETRIKQAAYELSLGEEVYRTDAIDGKVEVLNDKNRTVTINPGQFTLLMTKETVTIPSDKLAFISIKAKPKLKGLVNVSGFHVDPGFSGKLLFSVYNAGPSTITLRHDEPYFLIWFAELKQNLLSNDLYNNSGNNHQDQKGIPSEYIDALKSGELASPSALLKKIKDVEKIKINNEYLLKLFIGIAVTIGLKIMWDSNAEQKGYEMRVLEERTLKNLYEQIDSIKSNSISLGNIDSIIRESKQTPNGIK